MSDLRRIGEGLKRDWQSRGIVYSRVRCSVIKWFYIG